MKRRPQRIADDHEPVLFMKAQEFVDQDGFAPGEALHQAHNVLRDVSLLQNFSFLYLGEHGGDSLMRCSFRKADYRIHAFSSPHSVIRKSLEDIECQAER